MVWHTSRRIVLSIILTSRKAQRLPTDVMTSYTEADSHSANILMPANASLPYFIVISQGPKGPVIWPLPMAYETIEPLGSGHLYTESPLRTILFGRIWRNRGNHLLVRLRPRLCPSTPVPCRAKNALRYHETIVLSRMSAYSRYGFL